MALLVWVGAAAAAAAAAAGGARARLRPPVVVIPGSLHSKLEMSTAATDFSPLYLSWPQLRPPLSNQLKWIDSMVGACADRVHFSS